MKMLRTVGAIVLMMLCVVTGVVGGTARVANATTGPSAILPDSYTVNAKFAHQFVGQYILKTVPNAARIQSAALELERTTQGYMYGQGQFYGYDSSGSQISWVVTLYFVRQVGKSQLSIDLITSLVNGAKIGNLLVSTPKKSILSGTLLLYGKKYPVTFHQISSK